MKIPICCAAVRACIAVITLTVMQGAFAQMFDSNLLFAKRATAYGDPNFCRRYELTYETSSSIFDPANVKCTFDLSSDNSTTAQTVVFNFTPVSCTSVEYQGVSTALPLTAAKVTVTREGAVFPAGISDDQTALLEIIVGVLWFDLKVNAADDPMLSFAAGSSNKVITAGVAFDMATINASSIQSTTFQFQSVNSTLPSRPPGSSVPSDYDETFLALSQPYVGSATINKATGIVQSCNVSASFNLHGETESSTYSIHVINPNIGSDPDAPDPN